MQRTTLGASRSDGAPRAVLDHRFATLLANFSSGLAKAGRREQALAASQRAVDVYRELAAADPRAYEAEMARTLNMLSVRLAQAGHIDDSLAASEQAVDLYRRLAAAQPAAHEPELASLLNNVSIRLAKAGRHADALVASQQVLDIHRRLAAVDPATFEPHLWISLTNHADQLTDAGRDEDAQRLRAEASARRGDYHQQLVERLFEPAPPPPRDVEPDVERPALSGRRTSARCRPVVGSSRT